MLTQCGFNWAVCIERIEPRPLHLMRWEQKRIEFQFFENKHSKIFREVKNNM